MARQRNLRPKPSRDGQNDLSDRLEDPDPYYTTESRLDLPCLLYFPTLTVMFIVTGAAGTDRVVTARAGAAARRAAANAKLIN